MSQRFLVNERGAGSMTESGSRGFLGGFLGENCEILFFILVFLILFYGFGGYGYGYKE